MSIQNAAALPLCFDVVVICTPFLTLFLYLLGI